MAATSPYSPNDYQAVSNYRPYELPVNDILKAYVAQNAFWDAGAARVKSVYDDALNLKLSLEPNKEIRKKYMEDAEKQLAKLSTMDLSNPAVQRQGFALFKPLFQDEGIIYDDLTTRHYEKVRNDALAARGRDNGKEYSDINFQYAMDGYNEFLNSKDRMAGKSFYQKRKEYTPFYDYTEDFSKALKDCKPSSVETLSPVYGSDNAMTGYMKDVSSRGISAAQARGCLEAGLSGKAQRQLQIEGAVAYKNNISVLSSDTVTYLNSVGSNLSSTLQELAAKKHGLKDRKDITPEMKIALEAQIESEIKATQQEMDKTTHTINKLNSGDTTDLLNNFDQYAGSIYSFKKLYKKALASQFEESKVLYKADPVQLNAIRFSQEKALRQLDYEYDVSIEGIRNNFDREMKYLDLMYGGRGSSGKTTGADVFRDPVTGEITINPDLMRETGNLDQKPEVDTKIYEKLTGRVSELATQDSNNSLRLYNSLISRAERDQAFRETLLKGFNFGTTDDEWARFKGVTSNNRFLISSKGNAPGGIQETSWFKAYLKEKPNDEDANRWANDNMLINSGINTLNRKIELGEAEVAKRVGGDYRTQIQNSLKEMKSATDKNITVTPQEIQDAIEGRPSRVKIRDVRNPGSFSGPGMGSSGTLGKEISVNGTILTGKVYELYSNVVNTNQKVNNKLRSARVDVYNQLGFDREPWYFTPDDKSPLVQTLKSVLPKDEKGNPLDVSIISSDFSGGVKVAIPGSKKGSEEIVTLLRNAGVGTSAEATEDGIVTIRGTRHNLINQAINNPILADAAYQLQTIAETSIFKSAQPGAKIQGTDIKVPVLVNGKMTQMTIETYKNETEPEFKVFLEGATDPRPIITASNPYELFEKLARTPVELTKQIR